ncbi:unnamed protein product [Merluccius merluccius]
MDAIYGHRPANKGREGGLDSATTLLHSMIEDGKRKRSLFQQDQTAVMRDIHADDVAQQEQNLALPQVGHASLGEELAPVSGVILVPRGFLVGHVLVSLAADWLLLPAEDCGEENQEED